MIYALALGCFVLGFVTRDVIASVFSALRLDKANRRSKRGGANIPPRDNRITLRPANSADEVVTAAPASRAERLFGQQAPH